MKYLLSFLAFLIVIAQPGFARPETYIVDRTKSKIDFIYQFDRNDLTGDFPNYAIDLNIDFDNIAKSFVSVILDTTTATGGIVFATQALRGPLVLDVARFPEIVFKSTRFRTKGQKIEIDGMITIRGITKPLTLKAQLFRGFNTEPGNRENLRIKITGRFNRHDFGASGFRSAVGSDMKIVIIAEINRK